MRIVTNTPNKLVLEVRYTVLGAITWVSSALLLYGLFNKWSEFDLSTRCAIGATCLAFAAVTVFFLRPSIFDFDRLTGQFRWTRPGLFKSHHGSVRLDRIKRVRVDKEESEGTPIYQIFVETNGEKVPLHHTHSSGAASDYHQTVDLIRTWLGR